MAAAEKVKLDESEPTRPELWSEVRVDPVEIALPKGGSGYTLRAYRPVTDITPTDVSGRETDDPFPERTHRRIVTDEKALDEDEYADDDSEAAASDTLDDDELDDEDEDDELDDDELDEDDEDEEEDDDEDDEDDEEEAEEAAAEPEEVPVFLGHGGRLYLFRTVEGLVEFVRSDAEHDLKQLDTWADLTGRITAEDVVPLTEDTYELDLVVSNLRGGHDAWDADLLIQAGEVARDIGYALRVESIINALAPGSPLDDLDEALRATESGGIGGFRARRRLRKIGAEAAPLGWRTIIGKISGLVDWRD
jgi:DNA-directed RNA polymerase delta subunit